jgi:hypothetical protein
MFDCILIFVVNHLKSIAAFGENRSEIVGVINEKFNGIELIASV